MWTYLDLWEDLFNLHLNVFRCFALRSLAPFGDWWLHADSSDAVRTFLLGILARGIVHSDDSASPGDNRDRFDWRARLHTSTDVIRLACSTRKIYGGQPRSVLENYPFDYAHTDYAYGSKNLSVNIFDFVAAQGSENSSAMYIPIVFSFIALWLVVMAVTVYIYLKLTNMQAVERTSPLFAILARQVDKNATDLEEIAILSLVSDEDESPNSEITPAELDALPVDNYPDLEEVALWTLILDDEDNTSDEGMFTVPGANILPVVDPDFRFIDRLVQSNLRKVSAKSVEEHLSHQCSYEFPLNRGSNGVDEAQPSQRDENLVVVEPDHSCSPVLSTEDVSDITSSVQQSSHQFSAPKPQQSDEFILSNEHEEPIVLNARSVVDIPGVDTADMSNHTFGCPSTIEWTPLQTSPRLPRSCESASDLSGDENSVKSAGITDPPSPVDHSFYVYDRRTKSLRKPRSLGHFEQIVRSSEQMVRKVNGINPDDDFWRCEVEKATNQVSTTGEAPGLGKEASWRARSRTFSSVTVCNDAMSLDQQLQETSDESSAGRRDTKTRRYSMPTAAIVPDSLDLASNRAESHVGAKQGESMSTAKYIPPPKRGQFREYGSWRSTRAPQRETNTTLRTFFPFNCTPSHRVASAWMPGSLHIPNPPADEFAHIDALHELKKKLHTVTLCIEAPPLDMNEARGVRAGPGTEFSDGERLDISWRDKYENDPASRLCILKHQRSGTRGV